MENNPLERVIFSVDLVHDLHAYAKALRMLDTLRAMQQISEVEMCIGSYYELVEPSFMVLAKDWDNVIVTHLWQYIKGQDSVLRIPGDIRQPCTLETPSGIYIATLGPMKEERAHMVGDSWTYVMKTGKYFVC